MAASDIAYHRRRTNQEKVTRLQGRLDSIPNNLAYARRRLRDAKTSQCDRERILKNIANLEQEQASLRKVISQLRSYC